MADIRAGVIEPRSRATDPGSLPLAAAATAVNWGSAFLVSQFFLSLIDAIGVAATFWLFAAFCLIGWLWVYRTVPETKGRSLEEIERMWKAPA